MIATLETPQLEDQFVRRFADNKDALTAGDGSLDDLRARSIERFAELGIPTRKHEQWKYTDLAPVLRPDYRQAFAPAATGLTLDEIYEFLIPGLQGHVLVFVNGFFNRSLSLIHDLPDGVVLTNLADAFSTHRDVIARHYGSYADVDTEPFIALNTAFAQDGAFLYVPSGMTLDQPVHVLNITRTVGPFLVQPRHLFVVEAEGRATVIESYHSLSESEQLSNIVTELFVGERARLEHYRLQNENDTASQICATNGYQAGASYLSTVSLTLNGGLVRNNVSLHPDGEYCETHLSGLYMMKGSQHVDNHTFVEHSKPHCFSNELYKGILDDSASSAFSGMLLVRPAAQKTNAFQENKTILLTDDASSYAKPQLEIYADDVRCSHGATTGAVDPEALFYFRARGISEERARNMLLFAFVDDVISKIKVEPLHDYLQHTLSERLS